MEPLSFFVAMSFIFGVWTAESYKQKKEVKEQPKVAQTTNEGK